MNKVASGVDRFRNDDTGSVTAFGLFLLATVLCVGGLAIDYANALRVRTQLQLVGDSVAHAAIVVRETNDAATAKQRALEIAETMMPAARFGDIITAADIIFGTYDPQTRSFQADPGSDDAVLVNTARLAERSNPVATYFFQFAGIDSWNIRRQSVFETYVPTCLREGFVAEQQIDVTTGNHYTAGFCIHSNTRVELNNGNTFENGVIVSMPDRRDVVLPSGGLASNDGLQAALRDGFYDLRILERIGNISAGAVDPSSPYFRPYLTNLQPIEIDPKTKFDDSVWVQGRIHRLTCASQSKSASIHAGTSLRGGVLITNCQLRLGENVSLEDATIISTNSTASAVSSASGIRLGRNDNCATGGGAQIVTLGDVDFPQYLQMYGGQIIAGGNVSFTSDVTGMQGSSIIAGGSIRGTSDSIVGFCGGDGMENNFEALYFRMAA